MRPRTLLVAGTIGFFGVTGSGTAATVVTHAVTHVVSRPAARPATAAVAGTAGAAEMSTASPNVALGKQMAAAAGWTGSQWSCLDALWTRESHWETEVWNYQGSGAYGIPQSLPASKMASAGPDWQTNAATQIRWGLSYIAGRYSTPCGAWSHETENGWY
jgi:hypothetical protein